MERVVDTLVWTFISKLSMITTPSDMFHSQFRIENKDKNGKLDFPYCWEGNCQRMTSEVKICFWMTFQLSPCLACATPSDISGSILLVGKTMRICLINTRNTWAPRGMCVCKWSKLELFCYFFKVGYCTCLFAVGVTYNGKYFTDFITDMHYSWAEFRIKSTKLDLKAQRELKFL